MNVGVEPQKESKFASSLDEMSKVMKKSNNAGLTQQRRRHSSAAKPSLCFGTVQVYEFPIVVGDNPEVSKGCPVTIDWEPKTKTELEVNKYEYHKAARRRSNNSSQIRKVTGSHNKGDELKLSESERLQLLLDAGFSSAEIKQGTTEAETIKKLRAETNKQKRWDNFHEAVEVTGRTMKKIVSIPRGKKNSKSSVATYPPSKSQRR